MRSQNVITLWQAGGFMSTILYETRIYDDLAEFYSLWRDAYLGQKGSEAKEITFLLDVFASSKKIKTIIDLGGGTGIHAIPLSKHGFDLTIFDKAAHALSIAKRSASAVNTVGGSFETISLNQTFDASMAMLSSLTYILDESGRKHFYSWLAGHTSDLIIIDQGNFYSYEKTLSDHLCGEDKHFNLRIARDWHMEGSRRHTNFSYEFVDKESDSAKVIADEQIQRYLSAEELIAYLGKDWRLVALLGSYDLKQMFDKQSSKRMICLFKRA
jgi:hypothetical protein